LELVAESDRLVASVDDLLLLLLGQLEVEDIHVFLLEVQGVGLGDDHVFSAETPVEHDLHHGLVVLGSQFLKVLVVSQIRPVGRDKAISFLKGARSGHRGEGHGNDVFGKQELDELRLGALRVELHLVHYRLYLGVGEQVPDQLGVEVRHSDALGQTLLHQSLHLRPEHMERLLGVCVVSQGPVNEVQVHVLKS
jgi:hypothetical protein